MTRSVNLQQIRNFGIVAHVDAGKTTVTERMLYLSGAIHKSGDVHHGSTTTDSDALEQRKGITINAAVVTCAWNSHQLHLVDTPGHIDFSADVELSLRVLDGAVVVLDGVAGVEPQTETVWEQADRYDLPRICFVNKLDRDGASLERCLESIRTRLGVDPVVVMLPVLSEAGLVGVVDVIRGVAYSWQNQGFDYEETQIPDELIEAAREARRVVVERCADWDDGVAESYLSDEPISNEELQRALRQATLRGGLVPALCGSAYKNRGMQQLLDAICLYLPAPCDRPPVVGRGQEIRHPRDDESFTALAFKITHDDFGQLTLIRVYSGRVEKGDRVLVGGRSQRLGRLVHVFADQRAEADSACTGDIVGLVGIQLAVGDTLSAPERPMVLPRPVLPEPVMRVCIEPVGREDRARLGEALSRLTRSDPSLLTESDSETGRAVLCGLGELHLEIAVENLRSQHRTDVRVGAPSVAYREAIRKEVRHEYKFSKQTGGPGQFAHVVLTLGPGAAGTGLTFSDEIRGGVIAREFIPAVRAGVRDAMSQGVLAGYPIFDLHVRLVDGAMHPKDSNERAFRTATWRCATEAVRQANPYLLEPVMALEVVTPEEFLGKVIGDLSTRRGRISAIDERNARRVVRATVPLSELFGYVGTLRSLTSGRGAFASEFGTYQAVPESVARRVLETTAA